MERAQWGFQEAGMASRKVGLDEELKFEGGSKVILRLCLYTQEQAWHRGKGT